MYLVAVEEKQPFFVRHRTLPLYFLAGTWFWNIYRFATEPYHWLGTVNVLMVPIVMSVAFYFMAGHARNWWRMYFGHYVSIGTSTRAAELGLSENVDKAIAQWINESGIKTYHRHGSYYYQFLRKKDAAMFKLAWG